MHVTVLFKLFPFISLQTSPVASHPMISKQLDFTGVRQSQDGSGRFISRVNFQFSPRKEAAYANARPFKGEEKYGPPKWDGCVRTCTY